MRPSASVQVRFASFAALGLSALSGCAQEEAKAPPAPVTKEMEEQARASDKYLMEQMKGAGKPAAKTAPK